VALRLIGVAAATTLFMAAAPANACFPPAIGFARGSVALDASGRAEIDRRAAEFRRSPRGSRLDLESIGDTAGSAEANRRMAWRRAEAVRAAFVRRGVPAGLIDVQLSPAGNGWAREVWITITTRPGCV
jgi:outer membrane protein OmpA-like peptidoglycan-associated protein